MSEWATDDGRVDVAGVMNRIREKIRGRRDLGLYTDEEVEELHAHSSCRPSPTTPASTPSCSRG